MIEAGIDMLIPPAYLELMPMVRFWRVIECLDKSLLNIGITDVFTGTFRAHEAKQSPALPKINAGSVCDQ